MSTNTTRLTLVKPDPQENYSVDVVNANSDKLDTTIGAAPATSTTLPSSLLFDGRLAHEDDTDELAIRRGTVWRYLGTAAATANRLARRGAGGRLKVGTATAADEAVTKAQLDAVAGSIPAAYTPPAAYGPWVTPTLNGRTSLTGYAPLRYRRLFITNEVEIKGVLAAGGAAATLFTLQAGFIPNYSYARGGQNGAAASVEWYVFNTGIVQVPSTGSFLEIDATIPLD